MKTPATAKLKDYGDTKIMGTAPFEKICAHKLPGTLNESDKDVTRKVSQGRLRKTAVF